MECIIVALHSHALRSCVVYLTLIVIDNENSITRSLLSLCSCLSVCLSVCLALLSPRLIAELCLVVSSMKDLLENVASQNIVDFIKETLFKSNFNVCVLMFVTSFFILAK